MKIIENGKGIVAGFEEIDFDKYPDLKVVGYNTTGEDHINAQEHVTRGIKIITLKGETEFLQSITSTSEHTIGLMIALARNYKRAFNETEERIVGHRLAGKNILIFGNGRIGEQVGATILRLGMKGTFATRGAMKLKYKRKLFKRISSSDYITLHIPLENNEGFFTKEMFKQMKPTAYFINTSRSKIVEDGALLWALENKEIAGAAVDFVDDPGLLGYKGDNLILTNHLGGATVEDMQKTEEFVTQKVKKYINATRS